MNVLRNTCSSRNAFRLIIAASLTLLPLIAMNNALACATCGCSLSTDAAMGYSAATGFRMSLEYDYINQNQLRTGTSTISPAQVAAINDQEVEHDTINRYITMGLSYSSSADWNFKLLVPYIDRSHTTYGSNPPSITPDQLSGATASGLGDIKFITSFQGLLPTHNLGVQLGVKLPTGDYGGPNASGTGTVGRNPVNFNTGPNMGTPLDTSLQAGTGSTDLIIGAYYYQAVSQNFDAFINGQFQAAVMHILNQPGEDYRPGNQENVSFGVRYEADPRIVPQLQVNVTHRSQDQGVLADTLNVAGTAVYLSPGVSAGIMKNTQVYAFVQLPVYSNLDGYQLFPRWTATVGIGYAF